MEINLENVKMLCFFGPVKAYDTARRARMIGGVPDIIDFVEKADLFVYNGRSYSPSDFQHLVDGLMEN